MTDLILAVDVGTSAVKAVLFDSDAQQVARVRRSYPVLKPQDGWGEQEPQVVYHAVLSAMKEAVEAVDGVQNLRGISFSAQLYSVLAVDRDGHVLTNSITWSDTRSIEQAQRLRKHECAAGIIARTGCPIDALYPLAKILWLKENYDLPTDARFISIKDYVLFRLTGRLVADWSMASSTGMFDIRRYCWDDTAMGLIGINANNLADLVSPRHFLTNQKKEILKSLGIPPNIPLIIGSGDAPFSSIGAGALDPDVLAVNVGASAAARLLVPQPPVDPAGGLWTYVADEGLWITGGMVSCGGIVFDWFLENWFDSPKDQARSTALELASAVSPGADNLLFIPYLRGEQSPDWRPVTRGSFHGLGLNHHRGHMARAVLEGITRSIYRAAERIQVVTGTTIKEMRITGGLTSSPLWRQIAADMFGKAVVVPTTVEGSARGAAMLAMLTLEKKSTYKDFFDRADTSKRVQPRDQVHELYCQQYQYFLHYLDCSRNNPKGAKTSSRQQ